MKRFLLGALLALCTATSYAQTSANATTDVKSQAGASSDVANQQAINFNSPEEVKYAGKFRVEQASSVVMGGFAGSFSSNNCANTSQAGLSSFWFGAAAGGPKESIACNKRQNGVMFSQQAVTAAQLGYKDMATKLVSMANWQLCTVDDETRKACLQAGLVVPTDKE